jgi:hypothetical protein
MIYDGEENEDAFYGCGIIQRRSLGILMREHGHVFNGSQRRLCFELSVWTCCGRCIRGSQRFDLLISGYCLHIGKY